MSNKENENVNENVNEVNENVNEVDDYEDDEEIGVNGIAWVMLWNGEEANEPSKEAWGALWDNIHDTIKEKGIELGSVHDEAHINEIAELISGVIQEGHGGVKYKVNYVSLDNMFRFQVGFEEAANDEVPSETTAGELKNVDVGIPVGNGLGITNRQILSSGA